MFQSSAQIHEQAARPDPEPKRCARCDQPVPSGRRTLCSLECRRALAEQRQKTRRETGRRSRPRSKVTSPKHLTRRELATHGAGLTEADLETVRLEKPTQCPGRDGPCPWVSCKHHLYLDITAAGGLQINFPDLEPWELTEPCSLAIARRGFLTLEEVGQRMNLTRERIRQVEARGLLKLRRVNRLERPDSETGHHWSEVEA